MKKLLLVIITVLMFACGSNKQSEEQALLDSLSTYDTDLPEISQEVINNVIQQIPSPLEISALIKLSGARYNSNYLNEPDNYSRYNTSFTRALNLGIYATDLGYANLYEESQESILFIGAIKELADELRIGQYFNFETIERLAERKDLDSLLLLTTQNFNDINTYLNEQNRPTISALMLVGGWLEALHIACSVEEISPDHLGLKEKIGEQKIVIDRIKELLGYFIESDQEIRSLYNQILELEDIYQSVTIDETYGEPTFEEVDGVLVSRDNRVTTINVSQDSIDQIQEKTSSIRSSIII